MRPHRNQPSRRPHFPGASDRDLATIDRNATEAHFAPGETLIREGAYGHEVFLLIDGEAEVRVDGRRVATLRPGDVAGELALLGTARRTATVVATTDLMVMVSNPREFAAILADAPQLATRIRRSAGARLAARPSFGVRSA